MKYFKIYHQNVIAVKPYLEITKDDFDVEVGDYAVWATRDIDAFEDEDGNIDYDACDKAMNEVCEQAERDARSEDGFNCGDYTLYIRGDEYSKYDFTRPSGGSR